MNNDASPTREESRQYSESIWKSSGTPPPTTTARTRATLEAMQGGRYQADECHPLYVLSAELEASVHDLTAQLSASQGEAERLRGAFQKIARPDFTHEENYPKEIDDSCGDNKLCPIFAEYVARTEETYKAVARDALNSAPLGPTGEGRKVSYDPLDSFEDGLSSCCNARVMLGHICSRCKEHCDVDESVEREFSAEQHEIIKRMELEANEREH